MRKYPVYRQNGNSASIEFVSNQEREEFWKQVYLASINGRLVTFKDQPKNWADEALKEFDARFNSTDGSNLGPT